MYTIAPVRPHAWPARSKVKACLVFSLSVVCLAPS